MFRIRRIYDDVAPVNKLAVAQVQAILRSQFPLLREEEISVLPAALRNPLKYRFRSILFVADDSKGQVKGFAFLSHEPVLKFCFLDFISAAKKLTGRGIGGALYARVRQEAFSLKTVGLFFECLPDHPKLSRDPQVRKANAAVLRFYETYGARPIVNTAYETPLTPGGDNPPYLVFDNLGQDVPLPCQRARTIVRAILERKYGSSCPPSYVDMVVRSFRDNPIRLRQPRYVKEKPAATVSRSIPPDKRISLFVNDRHDIHHVRERGYVESPVRIKTILHAIESMGLFERLPVKHFSDRYIKAVHDPRFVAYLKRVCEHVEPGKSLYPYVFPIRNSARPPKELPVRAGYYCMDTFTPLNRNAYIAAERAVDCALSAAAQVLEGRPMAYALVRPPGHHAERHAFGGFCYLNSSAIAANYLSRHGRVTILDIDYHHGNGQQDIFYDRSDVVTVSIHGRPSLAYPYFSGFADERGAGPGEGFNANFPLPEQVDGKHYHAVLEKALRRLRKHKPDFLVVAFGADTAKGDPTGTWSLKATDFETNGQLIGRLRLPTLVVQEGGYNHRNLGVNVRHFFTGLWTVLYG